MLIVSRTLVRNRRTLVHTVCCIPKLGMSVPKMGIFVWFLA